MLTTIKRLSHLTAGDLMSREVLTISQNMSLHAAAHLLSEIHVSGAPVVDENGVCVGVISSTDFVHWADSGPKSRPRSKSDSCVCVPWQMVEIDSLPSDVVGSFMSTDTVFISPETKMADVARAMVDAHIHRVIVTDDKRRPIGVVSSTDVIAAVARTEANE